MLPDPSQTRFWQSFGVCELTAVPFAVKVSPQVPVVQVNVLHSASTPQSAGTRHWTHWPVALHKWPGPSVHGVDAATGGFEGTSPVQTSLVHCFPSTGTSLVRATVSVLPVPLHCICLQSPA